MGQVLHRRAAATEAVRRAMQNSQESPLRSLALWDQPEDTSQMEEKDLDGRSSHRAERGSLHGSVD